MPEQFGAYKVRQPLGNVGPIAVYHAVDEWGDDARVTAYTPPADLSAEDRARIVSTLERTLVALLEAPPTQGSLQVTGGGEQDGRIFIAESWPGTPSLREQVGAAGPMSSETTVGMLQSIAVALDACHQTGAFHPWLAPDNVFLNGTTVTLGGQFWTVLLPMVREVAPSFQWPAGSYVAPEVIAGGLADARSESYSAAALALFGLSGGDPAPGEPVGIDAPPALVRSLRLSLSANSGERCSCVKAIVVEVAVEQAITMQDEGASEVPLGGDVPDWATTLLKETTQRRATGKPLVDGVTQPQAAAPPPRMARAHSVPVPPPPVETIPPFAPAAPSRNHTRPQPEVIRREPRPVTPAPAAPRRRNTGSSRFDWNEGATRRRFPIGLALAAGAVIVFIVIGIAATWMR